MRISTDYPGFETLVRVANQLGNLTKECVFVGGACVGLYLTDPVSREPRVTKDVDLIVEASTNIAFAQLEERLRKAGFQPDTESGIICRHRCRDLIIDMMPTNSDILGFSNSWYSDAITASVPVQIGEEKAIRIATPFHFIAMKIEAFENRGKGDFALSHDLEDILTVLDFRESIESDVLRGDMRALGFVAETFGRWLDSSSFQESVSGHLLPDEASQGRRDIILTRMANIAGNSNLDYRH